MRTSDVDEMLATLYLRLNGYFTTGLIVHSPEHGRALAEIDGLAIRHPFHTQPERNVDISEFLLVEGKVADFLLCEVKSDPTRICFNNPIKTDKTVREAIVGWSGLFQPDQASDAVEAIEALVTGKLEVQQRREGLVVGDCRIRALLVCPSRQEPMEDEWCLRGADLMTYVIRCLNPVESRPTCSVRYNFSQWGFPLSRIVRYIKDQPAGRHVEVGEIYQLFGVEAIAQQAPETIQD
ncbi:hypothetical protein [Rhizobium sp. CNPSo 4039]|uniref:hypothetical protein n=1 Tax=Rhizobium sp. CNPSo 4039 TaxID=3021409 RepID=UPI00254E5F79|nr:hypothetical protein [Rhizobium sp. CNPSo 4039]MDK4714682.1 hypothetical protein [Rhizobium sp. CNPSo 4039]